MERFYDTPDLRQFFTGRAHFPAVSHAGDPFIGYLNPNVGQHLEMEMVGPERMDLGCDQGLEGFVGEGGRERWARQATLALLEIRSRLDARFKQASHKGPLWDEVSRIMAEEHGYQRSGKQCREKLENLYKYYKKTKEGKVGRQDGKYYRFFMQLEALYGENGNGVANNEIPIDNNAKSVANSQPQHIHQELSHPPKSSKNENAFSFCSSKDVEGEGSCKKNGRREKWKIKIKAYMELQMKDFMVRQEAWLENVLKSIEQTEQERINREKTWQCQETARFDRERELRAKERAWIEARDTVLIEALKKITREEPKVKANVPSPTDIEILSLIKQRSDMEFRFQEGGCSKRVLWEEISDKMSDLSCNRNAKRCRREVGEHQQVFQEGHAPLTHYSSIGGSPGSR
ncbi:trihelix transcription factor PTL-like [Tasmannia lanceolata]|uniref:trihelix transcription factor PTL-like n=1 Tax=Tasmannia lanceolata TaxID=3420 RepID=UPI004062BA2C